MKHAAVCTLSKLKKDYYIKSLRQGVEGTFECFTFETYLPKRRR